MNKGGTRGAGPSRQAAFTHFNARGRAQMVDVTGKRVTAREAVARGVVRMKAATLDRILAGEVEKGDVFTVARVAAIQAAKKTWEWVPMCHPLEITGTEISFEPGGADPAEAGGARVSIEARVRTRGRTGVEMEALAAVAAAGLTIYDMCKAVDREMTIGEVRLVRKHGGRSGTFVRREP